MIRLPLLALVLALAACGDVPSKLTDTGAPAPTDADQDGFSSGSDCDDADPAVHPGAPEICNGLDDDCDGFVDDDDPDVQDLLTFHPDVDGDGYGDPGEGREGCTPEDGEVEDGSDCDDLDPEVNPGAAEICNGADDDCDELVDDEDPDVEGALLLHPDADGDGFGDAHQEVWSCDPLDGYVDDGTDCDDGSPEVHPGAVEVCNGLDDDCDGTTDGEAAEGAVSWYADTDGDGFGDAEVATVDCAAPEGFVADATDCDDTRPEVNPGADEVCNGLDDDCDGTADGEDAADAATWYTDADGDGFGDPGGASRACTAPSGAVADGSDCDDTRAEVNPDAEEICNGLDDDCDGVADGASATDPGTWYRDFDGDGYGDAYTTTVACDAPSGYVADATDCDDGLADIHPGAGERCNGLDDDCDGSVDEGAVDPATWYADADGDGYGTTLTTATGCTAPSGYVAASTDCDDTDSSVHPGATEVCDGVDQDCDARIDEEAVDAGTWYDDADGDGYGDAASRSTACTAPSGAVADATDCDDSDASVHPGATEICDGVDQDCDGALDGTGLATFVGPYGAITDYTATLAAGTASAAVSVSLASSGTLSLCGGTWYAELDVSGATVSIVGLGGAALNVVSGDGNGSVVEVTSSATSLGLTGLTLTNGGAEYGGAVNSGTHGIALTIENCVISSSEAWYGGAIYQRNGTIDISGTSFTACDADEEGGALRLRDLTASLEDVAITGCSVGYDGGGAWFRDSTASLVDVAFDGNEADDLGGALYLRGSTVTVTGSTLSDNYGYYGGAVYATDGTLAFASSDIQDNASVCYGGGLYLEGTAATLASSRIHGNEATGSWTCYGRGGGALLYDGASLSCSGSSSTTAGIYANEADLGGGAYLYSTSDSLLSATCDWGTSSGGDDNVAMSSSYGKDVWLRDPSLGYSSYGSNVTFTCTGSLCW